MIEEKIVPCPACDGEGSWRRLEEIDEETGILKKSELCGFCDGRKKVRVEFAQKFVQMIHGGAGGGISGDPIGYVTNKIERTFTSQENYTSNIFKEFFLLPIYLSDSKSLYHEFICNCSNASDLLDKLLKIKEIKVEVDRYFIFFKKQDNHLIKLVDLLNTPLSVLHLIFENYKRRITIPNIEDSDEIKNILKLDITIKN